MHEWLLHWLSLIECSKHRNGMISFLILCSKVWLPVSLIIVLLSWVCMTSPTGSVGFTLRVLGQS
uniref:Uncharacterized protein n=1 Tax=Arundo donax TaxID=35708 RepID=A0A0A9ALC7_ARUDO